jgi:hypothetical protein
VVIKFEKARHAPLTEDGQVEARVLDLVGCALRRQIWLMFLDSRMVQLPVLLPTDIKERPGTRDSEPFTAFIAQAVEATQCAAVIAVLERPGRDALSDDDRAWVSLVVDAVRSTGVSLRGPLLSFSAGVRWIALEDYL